jgi:hypothetical protein
VVEGDGTIHLLPGDREPDDRSVRGIAVDRAGKQVGLAGHGPPFVGHRADSRSLRLWMLSGPPT